MNIVISTYPDGKVCCRPDTTWEKENRDFYVPDSADSIWWSPVVFARICKAGKCIGEKFVSRYYDAMNYGMLMYIGNPQDNMASASCADHTSVLPFPLYNKIVFGTANNRFIVGKDGQEIFNCTSEDAVTRVEKALCNVSALTSLRIGDIMAVELSAPERLVGKADGDTSLKATFCDNVIFDFKILL